MKQSWKAVHGNGLELQGVSESAPRHFAQMMVRNVRPFANAFIIT